MLLMAGTGAELHEYVTVGGRCWPLIPEADTHRNVTGLLTSVCDSIRRAAFVHCSSSTATEWA
jgi:hypothetical protein